VLIERVGSLLDGTVRENLLLGDALADEALRSVLQDVELWDELAPRGGLDLALSQGGAELSGGQRSRLQIARALLRRPKLLVIDGTLDTVELSQESRIRAALLRRGSTVVQVSARAESLCACDRVLRLGAAHAAVEERP
jgi:ABC-type transport system involved in cytochrome bd biosynthesis fused ATPase/permease subunit